jgi:hypothetical protein
MRLFFRSFFHYDAIVGAEAMHALKGLEKANAKEAKEDKPDDKGKKNLLKICYDNNKTAGCTYTNCKRIHKCLGSDVKGHMIFNCPEKKKIP